MVPGRVFPRSTVLLLFGLEAKIELLFEIIGNPAIFRGGHLNFERNQRSTGVLIIRCRIMKTLQTMRNYGKFFGNPIMNDG